MKRIINVDQMTVIGFFNESETDEKIRELQEKGYMFQPTMMVISLFGRNKKRAREDKSRAPNTDHY